MRELKAFVHCESEMERMGLMLMTDNLPFILELYFTDLSMMGIQQKLTDKPELIILCLYEADIDITLPQKIKLFAPDIPLLLLIPEVPDSFVYFLRSVMVDYILQKPFQETVFHTAVRQLLNR